MPTNSINLGNNLGNDCVKLNSLAKYLSKELGQEYHVVTGVSFNNRGHLVLDNQKAISMCLAIAPLEVKSFDVRFMLHDEDKIGYVDENDFDDLEFCTYSQDGTSLMCDSIICFMWSTDYEIDSDGDFVGYLNSGHICIKFLVDKYGYNIPNDVLNEIRGTIGCGSPELKDN